MIPRRRTLSICICSGLLIVFLMLAFWPMYRIWPLIDETDVFWGHDKIDILIVENDTTYHGSPLHYLVGCLLMQSWNRDMKHETYLFELQGGSLHQYRFQNLWARLPCISESHLCFLTGMTEKKRQYNKVINGKLVPLSDIEISRMMDDAKKGVIDSSWKTLSNIEILTNRNRTYPLNLGTGSYNLKINYRHNVAGKLSDYAEYSLSGPGIDGERRFYSVLNNSEGLSVSKNAFSKY